MLFARLSSNFALGGDAPRQQDWCEMVAAFSFHVMASGVLLKKIPSFLRSLVWRMLPFSKKIKKSQEEGVKMVRPIIERWRSGTTTADDKGTVTYWMLEHAKDEEKTPEEMANRVNAMILASVHTNGMTLTGVLFELCAHPDFFQILREEIAEVEQELGPMGAAGPETLQRQWIPRLEKMDSFIAEVLRYHQPVLCTSQGQTCCLCCLANLTSLSTLVAPNRQAMEDVTLRDGTVIPKDTWVTFPSGNIMKDGDFHQNPEVFDGLRNYNMRKEQVDASSKYLATHPTTSDLAFGFGNRACPGRFYALSALKMTLAKLLQDYDFKYSANKNPYMSVDEFSFIELGAKLMVRKRQPS